MRHLLREMRQFSLCILTIFVIQKKLSIETVIHIYTHEDKIN